MAEIDMDKFDVDYSEPGGSASFSDNFARSSFFSAKETGNKILMLDQLLPNPDKSFRYNKNSDYYKKLKESIIAEGIKEHVRVCPAVDENDVPIDNKFYIISGHTRVAIWEELGHSDLVCQVEKRSYLEAKQECILANALTRMSHCSVFESSRAMENLASTYKALCIKNGVTGYDVSKHVETVFGSACVKHYKYIVKMLPEFEQICNSRKTPVMEIYKISRLSLDLQRELVDILLADESLSPSVSLVKNNEPVKVKKATISSDSNLSSYIPLELREDKISSYKYTEAVLKCFSEHPDLMSRFQSYFDGIAKR